MIKSILVLEAPWDEDSVRSTSVWPFLNEFSRISSVEAFHQTFTNRESFQHWLKCYDAEKIPGDKMLYVAAHGTQGRIQSLGKKLNAKGITESLGACKTVNYAHFGSCFFGTEKRLYKLLEDVKHLRYAAGYSEVIPWIESMALDLLILDRLVNREEEEKRVHQTSLLKGMLSTVSGLASGLGFGFAYRYGPDRIFTSTTPDQQE